MRTKIIVITISVLFIATPAYAAEHNQSLFQRTVQGVFCSVAGLWNMNACSGKEQTAPRVPLASDLAVVALYGAASEGNTEAANPEKNNNGATIAEGQTASNQTIVNRYITQPVIERTLNTREIIRESGITQEQFTVALNELRKEIYNTQASADNQQNTAVWRAISLTNKIDNLAGVAFSGGTITSSPISGSTGSFSTLSASAATTLTGDLTVDASTLYVDSANNRIGIGTTSPTVKLDVSGDDESTKILITNTTSSSSHYPSLTIENYMGSLNGHPGIYLSNAQGSKDAPTAISGAKTLNRFIVKGYDGADFQVASDIWTGTESAWSVGSTPSVMTFRTNTGTGVTEKVRITSAGDVGIGDSTPTYKLDVNGTLRAVGAVTLDSTLGVTGDLTVDTSTLYVDSANNRVGIGTTSPAAQLHTTGSVRFATFGAGTLETDASGNLSVSSDVRLKDVRGDFDRSIDDLLGLKPIIYKWSKDSGFDTSTLYAGFSAQNVQENIPEAVGEDRRGFLTLSDRPIVATIVNSVKEIWDVISVLRSRMDSRDAELEARIAALEAQLASASTGTGAVSGGSQAETSSAPTIELVGNTPAEIKIGVTYSDLGVIARDGNGNDLSVSITVDGTATTNIEIDTSIDATYSIEYRAQDSSGQVATTTRTVIVGTGVAIEDVGTALPATATTTASTTEAITDNEVDQVSTPKPEAEQEGQDDSDVAPVDNVTSATTDETIDPASPANDNVATSTLETA